MLNLGFMWHTSLTTMTREKRTTRQTDMNRERQAGILEGETKTETNREIDRSAFTYRWYEGHKLWVETVRNYLRSPDLYRVRALRRGL